MDTQTCMCTHAHAHTCTCAHSHIHARAHTCTQAHTYMHAHVHARTITHTHTHLSHGTRKERAVSALGGFMWPGQGNFPGHPPQRVPRAPLFTCVHYADRSCPAELLAGGLSLLCLGNVCSSFEPTAKATPGLPPPQAEVRAVPPRTPAAPQGRAATKNLEQQFRVPAQRSPHPSSTLQTQNLPPGLPELLRAWQPKSKSTRRYQDPEFCCPRASAGSTRSLHRNPRAAAAGSRAPSLGSRAPSPGPPAPSPLLRHRCHGKPQRLQVLRSLPLLPGRDPVTQRGVMGGP